MTEKSNASTFILLLLCIGLFLSISALAQPEPSPPEEEWYPPEAGVFGINVTRGYFERALANAFSSTISFNVVTSSLLDKVNNAPISAKSSREEFRVVSVNLRVKDYAGNPVAGARVLAFSEDWGIRSPGTLDDRTFWLTDSEGKLSLSIPVGKWSFFVVSGFDYAFSHPGKGIFIVDINRTISEDLFIELKPSEKIIIFPKDVYGRAIDVEARVMETSHTPIIPTDVAAISSSGRLELEVSPSYSYDILLVKKPTQLFEGYYIKLNGIQAGFSGEVYFKTSDLAQVVFAAYDKENIPTEGNVEVRIPQFDLNNMVIDFTFQKKVAVYFTPGIYQFNYRFMPSGWYFYLGGNNFFNLTKGETKLVSFGGPFHVALQVIPWASRGIGGSPNFAPRTQVWLKITDSFDHVLLILGTPSGRPCFPFVLAKNNEIIYKSFIPQGDPFTLLIDREFEKDSSPNFTTTVDLGPFGKFELSGTLISDETMYKIQNITTKHFLAAVPVGFPNTTVRMLEFMDKLYEVYSDMVGGVPIEGQVQFEVDIMGGGFWWETLPVPAKILLVVYITSDPLSPNTLFFTAHEFGHTRTLRNPTFIAPDYFGESIPTMLAIEGLSRLYGRKIWFWGTGFHDLFFYHIRGVPLSSRSDLIETSQFVLAYIQRKYGWDAHKRVLSGWSGEFSSLVNKLRSVGFNDVEILAVIYSYVVGDNLGWLFDLAGLGVTEERVNQGLSYAVSKRSLSLKISLTEKPPFILNSIVELKGSIYPALSSEIELNVIKPNGKKNLLKVKSDEYGNFSFKFKVDEAGIWSVYARSPETSTYYSSTSNMLQFPVKAVLNLSVTVTIRSILEPEQNVVKGYNIYIEGRTAPVLSDLFVKLLVSFDNKTWIEVNKTSTKHDGSYSFSLHSLAYGQLYFKVVTEETETFIASESFPVLVHIPSPVEAKLEEELNRTKAELNNTITTINNLIQERSKMNEEINFYKSLLILLVPSCLIAGFATSYISVKYRAKKKDVSMRVK
jgi:hypothetical protein